MVSFVTVMAVNGPLTFDPGASEVPIGYWTSVFTQQYYTAMLERLRHLDLDRWFVALVMIHETGGDISQQELAIMLRQDKVTVVRAIDHLSAKGYVERHACPGDRRKHQLRTTVKARSAIRQIKKAYGEVNAIALKGLSEKERTKFMIQLSRAIQDLSGEKNVPVRIRYSKKLPK
jgi:DNA-binding MarR family transcriptional regulator